MGRHSSSSSESEEGSLSDNSDSSRGSKRKSKTRSSSSSKSGSSSPRAEKLRNPRSRPAHKQPESLCLSRYYREHFGNHSPEVYMNLRISSFRSSLGKEDVVDILEKELKKLAPFEIKVLPNPDGSDRLAYLNFKNDNCAKTVRHTMIKRLQSTLGPDIKIDPSGVLRDQEGKYVPDRFNRFQLAQDTSSRRRHSPPPPPRHQNHHQHNNNNNNNYGNNGGGRAFNLNREDHQATRTLFVGNLPGDVRHGELMKMFASYGPIEDIDIKHVNDGIAAYSFVVYTSVDSAMKALKNQHGRSVRSGSNKCQIGYGRSQVSPRLWIGGLGDWTTKEMLNKEFDRYGVIEQLEFTNDSQHAYIKFADVNSATDACAAMKNYTLYKDYRILVDYAKEKKVDRKRAKSPLPEDSTSSKKRKTRTPSPASSSHSKEAEDQITTYDQLNEKIACTWKGIIALKKTEYPLRLHRVHGREHLLQDLLRKEDGSAIKLKLDQRLPRDNAFYDKLLDMDLNQLAFMVGAEGSHSFTPLIDYLNDKKAIGMTKVGDSALLYLMPHCSLATKIVKKFASRVQLLKSDANYLLVILKSTDH